MTGAILVLNAGSSSLKFSLFAVNAQQRSPTSVYRGQISGLGTRARFFCQDAAGTILSDELLPGRPGLSFTHEDGLALLHRWLETHAGDFRLRAIGHRVVHGGTVYSAPTMVSKEVMAALGALIPLAPLHQPHNLAAIAAVARMAPALPQVACFDTAFHAPQPRVAQIFANPRVLTDAGVRRYGFHGLSYEYIARSLPAILGEAANGRVVVAHLGNGASMCALRNRKSVASTMGMTALDGLPMGTRCGAIDPGAVLLLLTKCKLDVAGVTDLLYEKSGLLGVSGIGSDVRELLGSDSPFAAEALALFVYRIGRELGSLAAALGGLDTLIFTGGIGEHAAPIRTRVCDDASWLGVRLDENANAGNSPLISRSDSRVAVWVIPTDEELMIARHVLDLLQPPAGTAAPQKAEEPV